MIRHKEQRVGVFVDVANMYHSAKNVYHARVNFQEILKEAVGERKLVRANAYVVKSPSQEEQGFLEALTKQGFDLKIKDLQIYPNGVKKADWDVGLSIDAVKMSDKLDAIVLVSGDGDYIPLLTYLREKGCTVEVMAFGETANSKLKEAADEFVDLSKDKRRYLMSIGGRSASYDRTSKRSSSSDTSIDRAVAAVQAAGGSASQPEVLNTVKPATRSTARTSSRRNTSRSTTGKTASRSTATRKTGLRSTLKRAMKK